MSRKIYRIFDCTDCRWDKPREAYCDKSIRRDRLLVYRVPLKTCNKFERRGRKMARLNTRTPRSPGLVEHIAREHPPTPDSIMGGLCDRIEHGGKRIAVTGRRNISEEAARVFFPSKKEEYDVKRVKKELSNIYYQLVYHCVDYCEDFSFYQPEKFCKKNHCVHKSIMKMLAPMLRNEIQFEIYKEKPKIRKRRIEIEE